LLTGDSSVPTLKRTLRQIAKGRKMKHCRNKGHYWMWGGATRKAAVCESKGLSRKVQGATERKGASRQPRFRMDTKKNPSLRTKG